MAGGEDLESETLDFREASGRRGPMGQMALHVDWQGGSDDASTLRFLVSALNGYPWAKV